MPKQSLTTDLEPKVWGRQDLELSFRASNCGLLWLLPKETAPWSGRCCLGSRHWRNCFLYHWVCPSEGSVLWGQQLCPSHHCIPCRLPIQGPHTCLCFFVLFCGYSRALVWEVLRWRGGGKESLETQVLLLERSCKGKNMVRQDKIQSKLWCPNVQSVWT